MNKQRQRQSQSQSAPLYVVFTLVALLALFGPYAASAADLFISLRDFQLRPKQVQVKLTPIAIPNVNLTNIVVPEIITRVTDSQGRTTFTNVISGNYALTILTTPQVGYNIGVPDSLATYNAKDLLTNRITLITNTVYVITDISILTNGMWMGGSNVYATNIVWVAAGEGINATTNANVITVNADVTTDALNDALNLYAPLTLLSSYATIAYVDAAIIGVTGATNGAPPSLVTNIARGEDVVLSNALQTQINAKQPYSSTLLVWSGIPPSSMQPAIGFPVMIASLNLTNWAALATNILAQFQPLLGYTAMPSNAFLAMWSGIPTNGIVFSTTSNTLHGFFIGNGNQLTNIPQASIIGLVNALANLQPYHSNLTAWAGILPSTKEDKWVVAPVQTTDGRTLNFPGTVIIGDLQFASTNAGYSEWQLSDGTPFAWVNTNGFTGSGRWLTNLHGTNIATGTVPTNALDSVAYAFILSGANAIAKTNGTGYGTTTLADLIVNGTITIPGSKTNYLGPTHLGARGGTNKYIFAGPDGVLNGVDLPGGSGKEVKAGDNVNTTTNGNEVTINVPLTGPSNDVQLARIDLTNFSRTTIGGNATSEVARALSLVISNSVDGVNTSTQYWKMPTYLEVGLATRYPIVSFGGYSAPYYPLSVTGGVSSINFSYPYSSHTMTNDLTLTNSGSWPASGYFRGAILKLKGGTNNYTLYVNTNWAAIGNNVTNTGTVITANKVWVLYFDMTDPGETNMHWGGSKQY